MIRADGGYRLGLAPDDVDAVRLAGRVARARARRARRRRRGRPRPRPHGARRWPSPGPVTCRGPSRTLRDDGRADRAEATAVLGRAAAALGDHDEALDAARGRWPTPTRPPSPRCCAPRPPCTAPPTALATLRDATATGVARRARRRPGPGAAGGARRAARRRPPGARGRALRRHAAGRPRRRRAPAAGARPRVAGHLDRRAGRARQDPARAPARPRGRAAGGALRRAGRRGVARRRHRRGRLGARRARLGQRPPGAHRRAARRRARPDRPAARPGADPAHPRQLRARRRRGRRPRGAARGRHPRSCGCVTTTRAPLAIAAERVFALGAARRRRRASSCSGSGPRPPGPACASTTTRCAASSPGSTACRWPSSWPPPRCGRCRSPTSTAGSTTGSRCCAAPTAAHPTATRPCSPSSTGRGTCSARPTARALRRLAVFHDGFALDGAEARARRRRAGVPGVAGRPVPAHGAEDGRDGLRYRMLETVREFGRLRLAEAGEDDDARGGAARLGDRPARARRSPASTAATRWRSCDALAVEENNLADVLRGALADADARARRACCWPRSAATGRSAATTPG